PTPSAASTYLMNSYDGASHGWIMSFSGFLPCLRMYKDGSNSGGVCSSVPVVANEWHHVAATFDGVNAKVYVDGKLGGSAATPGYTPAGTPTLAKPAWTSGSQFFGQIDELRMLNLVESASDLAGDALGPSGYLAR